MNTLTLTIAIPTFDRINSLSDIVSSLLTTEDTNFEILIGNDNALYADLLDDLWKDEYRVRVINNKVNLGERDNLNNLLNEGQGEYFVWIFDDDPCVSNLASIVNHAVNTLGFPDVMYTNYIDIAGSAKFKWYLNLDDVKFQKLDGESFLNRYWSGNLRALGCCGIFKTNILREMGGVAKLSGSKMAFHAEYLLLIQASRLKNIVYCTAPLVSTRAHFGSWSARNTEATTYIEGGLGLLDRAGHILTSQSLSRKDLTENMAAITRFVVSSVIVALYSARFNIDKDFKRFEEDLLNLLGNYDLGSKDDIRNIYHAQLIKYHAKGMVKKLLPYPLIYLYRRFSYYYNNHIHNQNVKSNQSGLP